MNPTSQPKINTAYIALGSNLGDRVLLMTRALDLLGQVRGATVRKISPIIETEPMEGPPEQPRYLNAVAELDTQLSPGDLLEQCQVIERRLDRTRDIPRGPRTIDLDLLLYEDQVLDTPDLQLPHPRMHERRFVLEPLCAIAPDVRHPVLNRTAADLLDSLEALCPDMA